MRFLRRLEQTLGRFAVPQVTMALIVVQVLTYAIVYTQPNPQKKLDAVQRLQLIPERLIEDGEWWRLVTFVAEPPFTNPVFAFFGWYLFYLMGTALEHTWGTFRYNLFLLVGWLATVAASFLTPQAPASIEFLGGSVFLAFAALYPDFLIVLFFFLPVRIKWLALLTWIWYGFLLIVGDWNSKAMILASICNFLLFFWREILDRAQTGHRRMTMQAKHVAARAKEPAYRHRCATCGITDKTHPNMEFRYCSKCAGALAYCSEHLRTHEHVTEPQEAK